MKKFILCLIAFTMAIPACFADELFLDKETKYQKQIMQMGFKILNANQIEKRMTFYYDTSKEVNAVTALTSKSIHVYKGIIPFMDSDDELAGILSHEISHGIDAHKGLWRRILMTSAPKSYEYQADQRAVDLMVNAGYNPVAMIIILNKISPEQNWFESSSTHPEGSKRLVAVYEYIYTQYPEYLINNKYQNNLYYQNFLLTTQKERKEIREKYTPSVKNVSNKQSK